MPVMTRISPATADRFALFIEALGAEAAELPHQLPARQGVEWRTLEEARGAVLALESAPREGGGAALRHP